jgi:hypothetical protein
VPIPSAEPATGGASPAVETPTPAAAPADEAKEEAGTRLKLKPKVVPPSSSVPPISMTGTNPPAAVSAIPQVVVPPSPPTVPPLPTPAPAAPAVAPVAALPPPLVPAGEKQPAPRRVAQLRLALVAGGVLVLAVGAFVAYRKFFAAPPPPPPKPAVTAKPAAPPKKVEPPAPGPAAPKAPAAPTRAPTPKATGISPPAAKAPAPAPAVAEVGPAPPAEAQPSMQFRAFVDRLKIGGFRVGPPARVFIGGITYQQGDVIDQDLGVVFVGVDPKTEALLFKDGSGAVLRRQL